MDVEMSKCSTTSLEIFLSVANTDRSRRRIITTELSTENPDPKMIKIIYGIDPNPEWEDYQKEIRRNRVLDISIKEIIKLTEAARAALNPQLPPRGINPADIEKKIRATETTHAWLP